MVELGMAIIGTGVVAERHAAAMHELHGARLVAVYDSNSERARAFAAEHGVRVAANLDELLGSGDVDVITIATPSGAHADVVIPVARAGKHVICEKPLETTLERVDLIIGACKEAGVVLSSVFQARFGDSVRIIREAINRGRFGTMVLADAQVKWFRSQEYYSGSAWRGTWALDGGGALMNQSIHIVDLLLHLAGPIEQVAAFAETLTHPGVEVEDTLVASLRFASGALGTIAVSTSCAPGFPRKLELSGEHGSVTLEDDRIVRWAFATEEDDDETIRLGGTSGEGLAGGASDPRAAGHEGHRRQFQDVVDAVREGHQPAIPGSEGRRAVELVTAIYEAARTGSIVRV